MTNSWPPAGFHEPVEYEVNQLSVSLIGLTVAIVFGLYSLPIIQRGADSLAKYPIQILAAYDLQFLEVLIPALLLSVFSWLILLTVVIVPIHEFIHYLFGIAFDLNPKFYWDDSWAIRNPSVIAMSSDIQVPKNIVMLIAPFALISISCAALTILTEGLVASSFAFLFLVNGVSSAQDLYHVGRLQDLPQGTLFRNYKADGALITEYAVPEKYFDWSDEEPHWARVLMVLYNSRTPMAERDTDATGSIPEDSPLLYQTELDKQELRAAIDYLKTSGLVDTRGSDMIRITETGFDVAHEREKTNEQNQINRALGWFTFVLVLVNLLSLYEGTGVRVVGGVLILTLLTYLMRRSGLF